MRKRWSRRVTRVSNALDLEGGVFALNDPRAIARSLKRSAMSMLNFHINRTGRNLPKARRACLEKAKEALRALYHRPRGGRS